MTQTTSPLLMSTSRPLRTSLSPNDFFSPLTEILTSVSDLPMLTAVSAHLLILFSRRFDSLVSAMMMMKYMTPMISHMLNDWKLRAMMMRPV